MADTQTPPKDDALQQPTDAVPMSDMGKDDALPQPTDTVPMGGVGKEPTGQSTDGLTVAVPEPSAAAAAERSPKGKSKEEDKQREDSLSIGPSDPPAEASEEPLVCTITLLLPTGARHPFRIDEKYLSKRSVEVPEVTDSGRKDPFSISVYKLKELILRGWRDDWEGKPASPSSIRLIFFGKLLEDKEQLKSAFVSRIRVAVLTPSRVPVQRGQPEHRPHVRPAARHDGGGRGGEGEGELPGRQESGERRRLLCHLMICFPTAF